MSDRGSYAEGVRKLLAAPRVVEKKPPRAAPWPVSHSEPEDLRCIYEACDGLALDDGVRLFGHGELRDVTEWLVLEKGLSWSDDLVVIGERRDMVIVLDLDVRNERAGGGVLEVGVDDLGAFDRVASSALGYLSARAGVEDEPEPPPEVAARRAAAASDRAALEQALSRPMYPGQPRPFVALAIELGALHAAAGQAELALSAFASSVEARAGSVTVDARIAERASGWRAAAIASRARGAEGIALECDRRARG